MAFLINMALILALGFLAWRMATTVERTTRALLRRSTALNDWQILELVRDFGKTLDVDVFQVRVLDMDQVNGLALPRGEIFISRGLYEKFLSGEVDREEVGGVIAHEIGHVALGHHQRRLRAWRTETAALAVLWFLLSRMMLGWIGLLAVLGLNVYRNQLSQRDEFEADAFSASLMARSGHNPKAIIGLLKKLEKWQGGSSAVPRLTWLMSHPPIEERIAALKRAIENDAKADAPDGDAPAGMA